MNVNMESKLSGVEISIDLSDNATWLDILEKVVNGLRAFGYNLPPTYKIVAALEELHSEVYD